MNENLKHILETAIDFENGSYNFYSELKMKVKNKALHSILDELAQSEIGHRDKLESLLGKMELDGEEKAFRKIEVKDKEDMKIADYLRPISIDENSTFQDILIAAMKREERAYKFYLNMLSYTTGEEGKKIIEFLAGEEKDHKNILEKIYEDEIYTEF